MIRILTDSTADFSKEEIAALNLTVIPLQVNIDGAQYLDGVSLSHNEFYELLQSSEKLPTTSQPSPEQFMVAFERAKQEGDTLICVLLASTLSGTYQSAQIAKEEIGYENIYLVDSQTLTLALGLMVRRALQRIDEGMSAAEIVADLELARNQIQLYAVVDTLKYLHKGGRLSGTAALAGGLLGIKPVIGVIEGKLSVTDKARGLPGAYLAIFKRIEKNGGISTEFPFTVGYTSNPNDINPILRHCKNNLHLESPWVSQIGSVIGTHAGPGACGIAFFANEPVR